MSKITIIDRELLNTDSCIQTYLDYLELAKSNYPNDSLPLLIEKTKDSIKYGMLFDEEKLCCIIMLFDAKIASMGLNNELSVVRICVENYLLHNADYAELEPTFDNIENSIRESLDLPAKVSK